MKRFSFWVLLPVLPALGLLPFLAQFPYAAHNMFTDLAVSHYPNTLYFQQSLLMFGQIPLWSPTILSGYPFSANPLSGLWYPPGWVALLFPQPLGMNVGTLVHVVFAGVGMYLFLRAEGLNQPAAALGGLALTAFPKLGAHFASGHLTLVYAVCWTPWLLWCTRRAAGVWWAAGQGLCLAAITLADPRWTIYAGLLWGSFHLRMLLQAGNKPIRAAWKTAQAVVAQAAVALLLAAPLLLPLAEYTRLATRDAMQVGDSLFLSLPVARLTGFLFPSMDGNTEWFVYPGAFLTVAFLWYLAQPRLWRGRGFWLLVALAGILLALGENLPGRALLAQVPGFRMMRVPARSLLVTGLAMAVLAANLLHDMTSSAFLGQRSAYFARLAVVAGMGMAMTAAIGASVLTGAPPLGVWWGAIALLLCGLLLFLRDRGILNQRVWVAGAVVFLMIDTVGVNALSIYFRPAAAVLEDGAGIARWISQQPGTFRVYSSGDDLPQQTAAYYGIEMINGVDPLQLRTYTHAFEAASGIPQARYDVVLPTGMIERRPDQANAPLLGRLNARYMIQTSDVSVPGLEWRATFGKARIYENRLVQPRAWVEKSDQTAVAVERIDIRPNDISLQASGPGLLVLSEIAYPGWTALVDGQPVKMVEDQVLRSVPLSPGAHQVVFRFRPKSLFLGLALCCAGLLITVFCLYWRSKTRNETI